MDEVKSSFYSDTSSSVVRQFSYPLRGKRGWLVFWLMISYSFCQTSLPINKLLVCALLFGPHAGLNAAKLLHQIRFQLMSNSVPDVESGGGRQHTFPLFTWVKMFWINRIMRVMPIYLLTLVLSLPPTIAGFGVVNHNLSTSFIQTLIVNIFPVSAWSLGFIGPPLTLSLWFMQVLMFLWLLAPALYLTLTQLTDHTLFRVIQAMYWMQLIIPPVLFVLIQSHMNLFEAFAISTFTPFTQQLFIFIAGFAAGIIQIRVPEDASTVGSWHTDLVHYFPWRALLGYKQEAMTKNAFAEATNRLTFVTFTMLVTGSVIGTVFTHNSVMGYPVVIWAAVLMPNLSQYAMLCDSMALLRSDSLSFNGNAMSHLSFQCFGRISFPLFMLLPVVTMYVQWFTHGSSVRWPSDDNCIAKYRILSPFPLDVRECSPEWQLFAESRLLSQWGAPVVMTISVLLAYLLITPLEALNQHFRIKVIDVDEKAMENEMTVLERIEETIANDDQVGDYQLVSPICDADKHAEDDIESCTQSRVTSASSMVALSSSISSTTVLKDFALLDLINSRSLSPSATALHRVLSTEKDHGKESTQIINETKHLITSPSSTSLNRIKLLEERSGVKLRRSSPSDLVGLLDKNKGLLHKVLSPSSEMKETEETWRNRNELRRMHAMMTASQLIGTVHNTMPGDEDNTNLRARSLESLKALKSVVVVRDDPALIISPQQEFTSAE